MILPNGKPGYRVDKCVICGGPFPPVGEYYVYIPDMLIQDKWASTSAFCSDGCVKVHHTQSALERM